MVDALLIVAWNIPAVWALAALAIVAIAASPWLTVPEAAARARCGPRTIQRAIEDKHLRATRVANRL